MKDKLLEKFVYDTELHKLAIEHSLDKGYTLAEANVIFQPEAWAILGNLIEQGNYHIKPPTITYRDKNTGNPISYNQALARNFKEVRELWVLDKLDRVVVNAFYKMLYNRFEQYIHPSCYSYRKGMSTAKVAKELNQSLATRRHYYVLKTDLSKFFDSVPIEVIDKYFDWMQSEEPSCIWKPIKEHYHDDRVVVNGELVKRYGSLRQGNAIGCLLADLILRELDAKMEQFEYYRYSDDVLIVCNSLKELINANRLLENELYDLGLKLNEKKTHVYNHNNWFEFLGYRFKGDKVTLTEKALRNIKIKVKAETIGKSNQLHRGLTKMEIIKAIDNIQYYFFVGCKEKPRGYMPYLWSACNVTEDIFEIDTWIKDCIRAAYTNKTQIYTPGISHGEYGLVPNIYDEKNNRRNYTGKNVGRNRIKAEDLPRELGWYPLMHMYKKYHSGKEVFQMEVIKMRNGIIVPVI